MDSCYDVYSDPQVFGLTPVVEFDLEVPDYSFDLLVVWYSFSTGKYYWGTDSGCSCPSPFENCSIAVGSGDSEEDISAKAAKVVEDRLTEVFDVPEAIAEVFTVQSDLSSNSQGFGGYGCERKLLIEGLVRGLGEFYEFHHGLEDSE